jgi:hypothetical protein
MVPIATEFGLALNVECENHWPFCVRTVVAFEIGEMWMRANSFPRFHFPNFPELSIRNGYFIPVVEWYVHHLSV